MNLQINLANTQGVSTSMPKLKPWEIHDVVLKKVEFTEFEGKKDPSAKYQVIRVRFENKDGYYEETIFAPKPEDVNRMATSSGGELASNFEVFTFLVAHLGQVLAPTRWEKMKGKSFDFGTPEGFKEFGELFVKLLEPALNKATKLKLIADKKGNVRLPYFVAVNKNGEAFLASNFIGDNLFFSTYEETQKNRIATAVPTQMSNVSITDDFEI